MKRYTPINLHAHSLMYTPTNHPIVTLHVFIISVSDIRINSGDGSNFNPLVTTSESEDDHRSNSASPPAPHSIYLTSTIPDFSRRFERQSWRERHVQLTTKITERLEIRRKEYYRDLTDRIDELEKGNHELELRNKEQLDNEEERAEHEGEGPSGSLQFDYSSYASPMGYYSPDPIDEVGGALCGCGLI